MNKAKNKSSNRRLRVELLLGKPSMYLVDHFIHIHKNTFKNQKLNCFKCKIVGRFQKNSYEK